MACRGGRLCHYSVSRRYRAGLGVPMPTCRRAIAQGASECVRRRWGWWGCRRQSTRWVLGVVCSQTTKQLGRWAASASFPTHLIAGADL